MNENKKVRSSISGRYTTKEEALANPDDTVCETPKRRINISLAVQTYMEASVLLVESESISLSREAISDLLNDFAKFYSKLSK